MKHFKLSAILALLLVCNFTFARMVTETLSSSKGDKVSITYEITQKNGKVTICFSNTSKMIGDHGRKYQKADEIVVLFFDRKGGYGDDVHFYGNINTNPFSVPAGLEYKKSEDGYYIIGQSTPPTLTFDMTATATVDLSIPIYLAWHPKRGKYEVFQHCGNLDIAIAPETTPQKKGSQQKTVEYAVEDEESSFSFEDEARQRIAHINALLDYQDDSFSPELVNEIASLTALKDKISNKRILKEIDETLERCNEKKDEIKQQVQQRENANKQEEEKAIEDAEFRNCRTAEDYDHFLKLYPNSEHKAEAEKNRDELKQEKENETKKQQKRTIWMIIGGALMAVLLFVGNQAMQSIRNIRTQRSIMEMQQDVTRKATGTAKRRTKSLIYNKTHQAMNVTRNKGRDLMQKGVEKTKTLNPKNKSNNQTNGTDGTNNAKTMNMKKKTNSNKQISI